MPRQNIDDQIAAKINEFVSELTALVREAAVESVADALGTGAAPRRAKTTTRRKTATATRKTRGSKRRTSADLEGLKATVLAHVQANDGDRLEQISKALGIASKELKRPVALLMEEGKLRTTGQRRGTKYHATTSGARRAVKKGVGKKRKTAGKRRAKRGSKKRASKKAA